MEILRTTISAFPNGIVSLQSFKVVLVALLVPRRNRADRHVLDRMRLSRIDLIDPSVIGMIFSTRRPAWLAIWPRRPPQRHTARAV
jgi:hypothetical protein